MVWLAGRGGLRLLGAPGDFRLSESGASARLKLSGRQLGLLVPRFDASESTRASELLWLAPAQVARAEARAVG